MTSGDKLLEKQAITWLIRLTSGEIKPAELKKFEQWRNQSPRHEMVLAEVRQLWLQLGQPLESCYRNQNIVTAFSSGPSSTRSMFTHFSPAATALTFMILVGVSYQWMTSWQFSYTTGTGEVRNFHLRDGSTVWLNTNSAVNVDVTQQHRHVSLARGEAFFDVKHDTNLAFTVDAGHGHVSVLGTAFSVKREHSDTLITVQRGRVQVTNDSNYVVEIAPNESVRVRSGKSSLMIDYVDAWQQLSWHQGQLIFVNQPLGKIFDELKRYDKRLLIINYPEANQQRISASIKLTQVDSWYDSLSQVLPLKVIKFGPVVWIKKTT